MSLSKTEKAKSELGYVVTFVRTLKLEGVVLAVLMVQLVREANQSLWLLPITFLLFDISAAGYFVNKKIGALTYNLGHSSVIPTLLLIAGLITDNRVLQLTSYSWLFHIGVDRALGYGLKHKTSFKHTHLGKL